MAYNGMFPTNYQPVNYQPNYQSVNYSQMQNNQQQNFGNLIWVQGEAGAKSYLVAPNNTVQLWDSESQTIYLKSADASGMPSMKILDYKIRNQEQVQAQPVMQGDTKTYVTIDEFKAELNKIKDELKELKHDTES